MENKVGLTKWCDESQAFKKVKKLAEGSHRHKYFKLFKIFSDAHYLALEREKLLQEGKLDSGELRLALIGVNQKFHAGYPLIFDQVCNGKVDTVFWDNIIEAKLAAIESSDNSVGKRKLVENFWVPEMLKKYPAPS